MKHPTFLQGIVIALGFALSGAAIFSTLTLVYASSFILKALITGFAGLYVIYLLARSEERTGRVTVPVLWLAGAMLTWLLSPGLMAFLIAHVAAVWLIRSLYYHSSVLPALLDLALCALSVVAAVAAARHTHSVLLSIWTLFLLQALFVLIPEVVRSNRVERAASLDEGFDRALRTAEAAVRRIHTVN